MKVLVIGSRVPYPLRDGGAIATYNLLKGLSEIGISVDFVCLNTKKHHVDISTIDKVFSFLNKVYSFSIDTSVKPIPALQNLFSNRSYNIERFVDASIAEMLKAICEKNAYDVIHFEGLFVADYVKVIRHPVKILRQHNIEYEIWKSLSKTLPIGFKRWYTSLLAHRLEIYEKLITKKFDAVVSITETDRINTRKQLGYDGQTTYIPAGIEIKQSSNEPIDQYSVYHIGSMEWMPNQEAMRWFHDSIWPLIESQESRIKFYMGGKHMPESFLGYAEGHFNVLGEIDNLDTFVSDKSILAVPLKSGSGIRIKTIEAMMSGKAVVTTSKGAQGLELINGENCMLADNEKAFADAIVYLCRDTNKRNEIAEKGKRYALEKFGNESVSRSWVTYYKSLLHI